MSKKFNLFGIVAVLALIFIIAGCSDQQKSPVAVTGLDKEGTVSINCEEPTPTTSECEPVVYPLLGGKTILVGNVTVWNDETNLYVQYNTTGDWYLTEVQLYVLTVEPTERLNPGHAPYKGENLDNVTTYTLTVPFAADWECDMTLYLQAHASVVKIVDGVIVQGETAYGGDINPDANPWYGNIAYTICCGEEPPPEPTCETAYAFGGEYATCFIGNGFSNWGWTNSLAEEGLYQFPVYAGAGQCDLEKGMLVGTVDLDYTGGTVTANLTLLEGFEATETHLYAGQGMFPLFKGNPTVAPGKYYVEPSLSGPIYAIFHAVVCWYDE